MSSILNPGATGVQGSRSYILNPTVTPVGYQGPGDIASGAIFFASTGRAYSHAFALTAGAIADLVDTSTGLLTCTMYVNTSGFADLTRLVYPTGSPTMNVVQYATTVGGASVTRLYDQTGHSNHVVQATLADMPALSFNELNGLPCTTGIGSGTVGLVSASSISQAAPYSLTFVSNRAVSGTTQAIFYNGTNTSQTVYPAAANTIRVNNGTAVSLTAADASPHAGLAVASATDPLFAIDSSANTSTSSNGTNTLSSNIAFMSTSALGSPLHGYVAEAGIWPSDLNSVYVTMLANMRSATNGWNF